MTCSVADKRYREQRLALGTKVLRRQRVYLDTCFWIRLRDHVSGVQPDERVAELLAILAEGAASARLVCPIEGSHLIELFKQADPTSRRATAGLMNQLSNGVCLAPPEERRRIELLYFLRKHTSPPRTNLYEPREFVWTRVSDVFGTLVPDDHEWTEEERTAIQTGFQDYLWTIGVEEALSVVGWEAQPPVPDLTALIVGLNEGKVAHQDEMRSLNQLERIELRGGLETVHELLTDALAYLYYCETGQHPTDAERADPTHARKLAAIIVAGYRKGTLGTDLPSLTIPARLYAAWRWDKQRRYRANDMLDLSHASAALPYCTVFLTDDDMAATIHKTRLEGLFACKVAGSIEDALATLGVS